MCSPDIPFTKGQTHRSAPTKKQSLTGLISTQYFVIPASEPESSFCNIINPQQIRHSGVSDFSLSDL